MPHASIKLVGGANQVETPALNENSGVQLTNLVRYMYSPNGETILQKLGGWSKFFPNPMPAIVRALWAWEDLNLNAWLAVGTQTITTSAQLSAITAGVQSVITPKLITDSIAPVVTATAGSSYLFITDTTTQGITNYDSVYIATQISIGGVVLFGLYPCDPTGLLSSTGYYVQAQDELGNALPATTSSTTPALPLFYTTIGSTTVLVTLPNYTYASGDTFSVLVPTTIGGVTFFGNYVVDQLISATQFSIITTTQATATTSGSLNGGNAVFIYNTGTGAIPPGSGYGINEYGEGGYGSGVTTTPATGTAIAAVDWTLDNFGEVLIACAIEANQTIPFQPVYAWNPGQGPATVIPQAPPVNDGIFVAMPQRQIVAWGSTETGIQDPLLINWCDVGNYNQWIATVTNQAGSYRIPKGSRIVACVQGPQQAIVWTDIDCWSMQYIGPPYVYGFNEIGSGCGLIARKAAAAVNGVYYWMGPSQFYTLSGSGVTPIPCPVWDVVFQNLNSGSSNGIPNTQRIRVAVNSRFGEIQWFYPSANGTGENDSYVKYNVYLGLWDYGTLGRTAWVDQSVLGPPIGADPTSLYLYQHETSNDADGQPMLSSFQTGYYALSETDVKAFVDWIKPDAKWGFFDATATATLTIKFLVADYAGQTPTVYGPYTVTQATEYFYTRFRSRLMAINISSNDLGSWWRIGNIRYRYSIDGKI